MSLKAYVLDHGWEGAEIYFSVDKANAVKYFRDKYVALYQERVYTHRPGIPNPWIKDVEKYRSSAFENSIEEFEIGEGVVITTDGEG